MVEQVFNLFRHRQAAGATKKEAGSKRTLPSSHLISLCVIQSNSNRDLTAIPLMAPRVVRVRVVSAIM